MALIGSVSGSHTNLADGTSYLIAGSNVAIVTGSNGSVTISSTASGTPGGSTTQVQFNDGGVFGGSSGLVYDKNTQTLSVGNLVVTGSTTTVTSSNLVISDRVIYFGSGAIGSNTNGGIALASGSTVANQSLVWGRVANDTWGAGRQDVIAGTSVDLTSMTLVGVRANKFEIGGSSAYVSSSDGLSVSINGGTQVTGTLTTTLAVGVGTSAPISALTNTSINNLDADGYGTILTTGFVWRGSGAGYAASYYNSDATNGVRNGVLFSIAGAGSGNRLIEFDSAGVRRGTMIGTGHMGLGAHGTPTAWLHIRSGTTAASSAPLKIDAGSLLATPEVGAVEYDATNYYGTLTGPTRKKFLMAGDITGTFNDSNSKLATSASVSFSGDVGPNTFVDTVGTDVYFYVSGATGAAKNSPTYRGMAVFGGAVVISSSLMGGVNQAGITNLDQVAQRFVFKDLASTIIIPGADTNFFVSGTRSSRATAVRGTAVFGGDVVVSGNLYNSAGVAYASAVTGTFNDSAAKFTTTASVSFAGARPESTAYNVSSVGSDVYFFVSGSTANTKGDPTLGRMAVFGGAVVLSSSLMGGVSPAGITSLDQVAQRFILKDAQTSITAVGADAYLTISGAIGSKGTLTRGTSIFTGDLFTSGVTYFGAVEENLLASNSIGSGVSNFDVSQQTIFYLTGTTADFTANFVNVPTTINRVISVNLLITQSATARKPTAVQIAGVAQTLLWANGVTPTANANKMDVFGFSFVRSGSTWASVLGQMSTYG